MPALIFQIIIIITYISRAEERLELRHVFEGHALGVVSVDINEEGSSKYFLF